MMDEDGVELDCAPVVIDNECELTLLRAVEQIVAVAEDSSLNEEVLALAERPITYLMDRLQLTRQQALLYSLFMSMFYDSSIVIMDIARYMSISPIAAMKFMPDIEHLVKLRYLRERTEDGKVFYRVDNDALQALKNNTELEPRSLKGLGAYEWFEELDRLFVSRCRGEMNYDTLVDEVELLVKDNLNLRFVDRYVNASLSLSVNDRMLFLWCCNMLVVDEKQTVMPEHFRELFDSPGLFNRVRTSLANGSNGLIKNSLLQVACHDGAGQRDSYELTPSVVEDMLTELNVNYAVRKRRDTIKYDTIVAKELFYNPQERVAVDRLTELLQPERFNSVREQLRNRGHRCGFACLFHGAPGTGKTETVLQLARKTGRDIIDVNVSQIKSMWVGESEKNLKGLFAYYKRVASESEKAPILLFNEADAIIGTRMTNVQHALDKMENSMQNILLEEIEKLDGILIATTNLPCNLDKAFERRFIYKIEFMQP
ncbi:MAG: AAA family ATPase, partial [Alistipes sp.]|nr:AAA family ATPase [Alistipes sp.]